MNLIGIKNAVTSKTEWKYLFLYDFDKPEYMERIPEIQKKLEFFRQAYIQRSTLNGMHVIGLTPNTALQWGMIQDSFQKAFPTYHDGQVIRLEPKPEEKQELVSINLQYPWAVNVAKITLRKMGLDPKHYLQDQNMLKQWWYVLIMYNAQKTKKTERYMFDGESRKAAQ